MQTKRYRVRDGVLRFEDGVIVFDDYINVPDTLTDVDFNEVQHILKPLNLRETNLKVLDFKKVLTVGNVYLPNGIILKENLYWASIITGKDILIQESPRMRVLGIYDNRDLIYLSGSVKGYIPLRTHQRAVLVKQGYAVYSPGNHITFGDPVADNNPALVADLDIAALVKSDIILFDLNNLSAGTCAELGYVIAKRWFETKRIYYFGKPTKNFFINGLLRQLTKVDSIEGFIERDKNELRTNAGFTT